MLLPVRATLDDPGHDLVGVCWKTDSDTAYVIRVCPRLDYISACETLLHEWCHLHYGEDEPTRFDLHDRGYWERYGEIYRAWHRTT